jgi:hypothetical protein
VVDAPNEVLSPVLDYKLDDCRFSAYRPDDVVYVLRPEPITVFL